MTAIKCALNLHDVLEEGYKLYKGKAFVIPELTGWRVIISGPDLVNELKNAPSDVMSWADAMRDVSQPILPPFKF